MNYIDGIIVFWKAMDSSTNNDRDISDINNAQVYGENRNSYGKVNRNRQMYVLDGELMAEEDQTDSRVISEAKSNS